MPVDCQDPDTLEAVQPCLNCYSMNELLAILVVMFSIENGTTGDVAALEAGAARFRNLGDLQLTREFMAALPDSFRAGLGFADLGDDFNCIKCYGAEKLKEMFLNQWCIY